jgi:hypothetical protein
MHYVEVLAPLEPNGKLLTWMAESSYDKDGVAWRVMAPNGEIAIYDNCTSAHDVRNYFNSLGIK